MPMSLREILAITPSGVLLQPLSLDELSTYLQREYHTEAERVREDRHLLREDLYHDGGTEALHALIDAVYEDPKVRHKRKQWARWARFDNVTKRVVNELSTVYQEPAQRSVESAQDDARYQIAIKLADIDRVSRAWSRALNLHRAVVVQPRVRWTREGRAPALDVITPNNCRLITHPNDPSYIVATATRVAPRTARATPRAPAWIVWSDAELFMLDQDFRLIGDTYREHTIGRRPTVFVSLETPSTGSPWPGSSGDDLVAAHMAIAFQAISMLKESKSATRQTILSGDVTNAARDQTLDTETPAALPDGVSATTVDMSLDLGIFRETADHILEHVANNYGMSAALIKHQGVQSADARELMRIPLRELRRDQQQVLRAFERELAETLAAVLAVDLPELAFDPAGWSINFGEAQTPLSPKEELERFEHERRLGLTTTLDYLMRLDPDLTEDGARDRLARNVQLETERNRMMRPLHAISGSPANLLPDIVIQGNTE